VSRRAWNQQRDVIEGLTIFMKYGGDHVCAEHDQIYASQKGGRAISKEDLAALKVAGWHIEQSLCTCDQNGSSDEDGEPGHSPKCTGWTRYV
jgi:hypothetical protein